MTGFTYKNWESDQGFEEQQAEVFNAANPFKYQPATADHVKKLFTRYQITANNILYAFSGKKMVGYIHARVQGQEKEIVLSYPWTLPDTPTEVRNTLYQGMIQSLIDQGDFTNFYLRANPMTKPETNIAFFLDQGFTIKNTWKELLLSVSDVANAEYDSKFNSRLGSEDDIEVLIELIKEDGSLMQQYSTDEKIKEYLLEKILPTGHTILVYENSTFCAACTPKEEEKRLIMDFAVFKNVKDQAPFIPLFVELARACLASGYGKNKPILVYTDNMDTPVAEQEFLQQFTPFKTEIIMYYCYKKLRILIPN